MLKKSIAFIVFYLSIIALMLFTYFYVQKHYAHEITHPQSELRIISRFSTLASWAPHRSFIVMATGYFLCNFTALLLKTCYAKYFSSIIFQRNEGINKGVLYSIHTQQCPVNILLCLNMRPILSCIRNKTPILNRISLQIRMLLFWEFAIASTIFDPPRLRLSPLIKGGSPVRRTCTMEGGRGDPIKWRQVVICILTGQFWLYLFPFIKLSLPFLNCHYLF